MNTKNVDVRIDHNTDGTIIGNALIIHFDGASSKELLERIADALRVLSNNMRKEVQQ